MGEFPSPNVGEAPRTNRLSLPTHNCSRGRFSEMIGLPTKTVHHINMLFVYFIYFMYIENPTFFKNAKKQKHSSTTRLLFIIPPSLFRIVFCKDPLFFKRIISGDQFFLRPHQRKKRPKWPTPSSHWDVLLVLNGCPFTPIFL